MSAYYFREQWRTVSPIRQNFALLISQGNFNEGWKNTVSASGTKPVRDDRIY